MAHIAAKVREDRERNPHVFYGPKSLWRAKAGDEIVGITHDFAGIRGEVIYPFGTDGASGITVKLKTMRTSCVVSANHFRHIDQNPEKV